MVGKTCPVLGQPHPTLGRCSHPPNGTNSSWVRVCPGWPPPRGQGPPHFLRLVLGLDLFQVPDLGLRLASLSRLVQETRKVLPASNCFQYATQARSFTRTHVKCCGGRGVRKTTEYSRFWFLHGQWVRRDQLQPFVKCISAAHEKQIQFIPDEDIMILLKHLGCAKRTKKKKIVLIVCPVQRVSSIRARYLVHTSCFLFIFCQKFGSDCVSALYQWKLGINVVFNSSLSEGILEFQKFRSDADGTAFCLSCLLFETFWKKDIN